MVAVGQPAPRLQINQSVSFVASFTPAPRNRYTIEIDAGDISGNHVLATYNLLTTPPPSAGPTTLSGTRSCASVAEIAEARTAISVVLTGRPGIGGRSGRPCSVPRDCAVPCGPGSRICSHDLRLSRRGDASADRRSLQVGGDLHHRVRLHPRRSDARHRRERAARLDRRARLDPRPTPLGVCRDVRAVRGRGPVRRRQRQPGARPRRRGRDLRRGR